jgi:hypothetical protein
MQVRVGYPALELFSDNMVHLRIQAPDFYNDKVVVKYPTPFTQKYNISKRGIVIR